ncbi:MAG: Uma2 family endonuclease [Thermosynechococcaceae cyanobacterium]
MIQTPQKTITLEAFLARPETEPASEYIDGVIIQKPMPQGKHSVIQGELVSTLNNIIKAPRIARAFPELRCSFGGHSTVPDIAVMLWNRIPRDVSGEVANVFPIAPDWAIEILSPGQSQTKVTKNILHCLQHGTQMGWLIDPAEQLVFVFYPEQQPIFYEDLEAPLPVPQFAQDFNLAVGELFGWLRE